MTLQNNKTPKETYDKTHNKSRASRTSAGLLPSILRMLGSRMLAILVLGSIALAFSCAPATPDGGNGDPTGPTAPGAPTDLAEASKESTSFVVQWVAPEAPNTGTKADGSSLEPSEIGYRVYYLAGQATPSAESLRQNPAVGIEVVRGSTDANITGLTPDTRYFVTVTSYNTTAPLLETASDDVIGVTTSMATPNLEGNPLSYGTETTHEFVIGVGGSIMPTSTPTIPSGKTIVYRLGSIDSVVFNPEPSIDNSNNIMNKGIITISPSTNVGTANYLVQAEVVDYTPQYVTLTIIVKKADFEGSLSYGTEGETRTTHEFSKGSEGTITPISTPSKPNTETRTGIRISYSIARNSGTEFMPEEPTINDSGVITINPIANDGTAIYTVQAMADDYNTQEATLTITIIEDEGGVRVSTYYMSGETDMLPVGLGQAVVDVGEFSMSDNTVVLTLSNLMDGDYTIRFGTEVEGAANNYNEIGYPITASNNTITIKKSVLPATNLGFSADGVVIGISGPGITETLHVATYYPSNIYGSHDLQAMRVSLDRDYVLKRNVEFDSLTDDTGKAISNYEAVGSEGEDTRFKGSLDGAGYTISGIEIVGTVDDNYQGLFGVMEASSVDIMAAQNLTLKDFKITANAYVGSLAGWIKKGTVDNVRVEVGNPDADPGKIEVSGSVRVSFSDYGYGEDFLVMQEQTQVTHK